MKTIYTLALLFSVWHVGQVAQNRTLNRGETTPPAAPVVTVYTAHYCTHCWRLKSDIKGKTQYDFRFVYPSRHPAWVDAVPYVTWYGKDKRRYFVSGWEDFETWEAAYRRTM